MRPAALCQHSAPRRALHQTTLHQIRLDHLFQSIAAFRKRRAKGLYAHRPARIMFGHQDQIAPIRAIKAHIIHAKAMQRMISQIARDGAIPLDQSEITKPSFFPS